ncbi:allophanate hydrolase-related protein [Acrocarpospora catenulata]|uniref:allophanate hydrolase-related protein n=1 Tax=Acrocarpospora catenulata TaxID=2836182 RepID=UPI001BD98A9B|nr:gamma-glutamylcyclotransferase [Acrocarpospora catenulata]
MRMFVNGQAMSGGSLNGALRDARFLGPAETAARYRFFAVREEFPGLYPVPTGGHPVPGELYEVTYEILRDHLLPGEPPELELTVIELADGSGSLSMRMREESLSLPGVVDISTAGGWRAYQAGGAR